MNLTTILDTFTRALRGALLASWVPPTVTFVMVFLPSIYSELNLGKLPFLEVFLRSFVAGLAVAAMAFLMGIILLILFGIPAIFFLRIFRINHPLIASILAALLTYWRFVISPSNGHPYSEDFTQLVIVAAITGYVAAMYANRNLKVANESKLI